MLAITLFGCSFETYDIQLKSKTFEYSKQKFDVCKVIEKVNNVKISSFNRTDGKIDQDDIHVLCPNVRIQELGKQEVTVKVNGSEVTLNFKIKDTTPPDIKFDRNTFNVEEGNEYFNIKKQVAINDKYDPNPIIGWSGEYDLKIPGEYILKVSASDESKNKSEKELKVIVSKKEVKVVEKEVIVNGSSNNAGSESGQVPSSTNNSGSNKIQSSLPSQTWLFSDGFDIQSGFDKCQAYRGSNSGSCKPLRDENTGLPYGYQYLP